MGVISGGGGGRGTRPLHVLKGGGHNIKCPHVFLTFVCAPPKSYTMYILINLGYRERPKIMNI